MDGRHQLLVVSMSQAQTWMSGTFMSRLMSELIRTAKEELGSVVKRMKCHMSYNTQEQILASL